MTEQVKISYSADIEVDIEEMAHQMTHEQAEFAIMEIDRVICDLDFTQKMAKRFIDAVRDEGLIDYIMELKEYLK